MTTYEQAAEEWRGATTFGRVSNLLFLFSATVSVAVLFLSLQASGAIPAIPLWDAFALGSSILHFGSLGLVANYMVHLKKKLSKEAYIKLNCRVSNIYGAVIFGLWLVTSILGLTARPDCTPDSDWWKAVVAANSARPVPYTDLDMASTCRMGIAVVSLSTVNAVILLMIMVPGLFFRSEHSEPDPPFHNFVQRMRFSRASRQPSEEEAEGLLDELEVWAKYKASGGRS